MNTPFRAPIKRVEDWFSTGEDYEATLRKAIRETESPKALDFLAVLEHSWKEYGMRAAMSEKVYRYLCSLADVDPDPSP